MDDTTRFLRSRAEEQYSDELKALHEYDTLERPEGWLLSPRAVVDYLIGTTLPDGTMISTKYFGSRRLIEIAVATLISDRALLILGVPGTAKTWVSEHLSAAISGQSDLIVQGTAGTDENQLRYSWNYAMLIAKGPSLESVVPGPVMRGMQEGKIVRLEELTRMHSDVQDTLITILSEKTLPIPELSFEVRAKAGFNVIATANDRDRGVNEFSSALARRFGTVYLPLPDSHEDEVAIVKSRLNDLGKKLKMPSQEFPLEELARLVTIFRELRTGVTEDGQTKLKSPSGTLSTAEIISVAQGSQALHTHFGKGGLGPEDLLPGIKSAVLKDKSQDLPIWEEYVDLVLRKRKNWNGWYEMAKK
jgi:YD repeat-containing protein